MRCAILAATSAASWVICSVVMPRMLLLMSLLRKCISSPQKLIGAYPHEVLGKTADVRNYLKDQTARSSRSQVVSKAPAKLSNLNGVWGEWTGQEIMSNQSPINPRLDDIEKELVTTLQIQVYVFMCYSADLWDEYNDNKLNLRKKGRILGGGLQLATKHMPQGNAITIPLTNNIGFQNITHVIVHLQNAEPDLGRKGFQPEHTKLAEKLSVSVVTAFRQFYGLLRKNTGASALIQTTQCTTDHLRCLKLQPGRLLRAMLLKIIGSRNVRLLQKRLRDMPLPVLKKRGVISEMNGEPGPPTTNNPKT